MLYLIIAFFLIKKKIMDICLIKQKKVFFTKFLFNHNNKIKYKKYYH